MSFGSRFVVVVKATKRPPGLMEECSTSAEAGVPVVPTFARITPPVSMSLTKTSALPLLSPVTRLLAPLRNWM